MRKSVVAVQTPELLKRMWCAGEPLHHGFWRFYVWLLRPPYTQTPETLKPELGFWSVTSPWKLKLKELLMNRTAKELVTAHKNKVTTVPLICDGFWLAEWVHFTLSRLNIIPYRTNSVHLFCASELSNWGFMSITDEDLETRYRCWLFWLRLAEPSPLLIPSTLTPNPRTLNPQPPTLNPKP